MLRRAILEKYRGWPSGMRWTFENDPYTAGMTAELSAEHPRRGWRPSNGWIGKHRPPGQLYRFDVCGQQLRRWRRIYGRRGSDEKSAAHAGSASPFMIRLAGVFRTHQRARGDQTDPRGLELVRKPLRRIDCLPAVLLSNVGSFVQKLQAGRARSCCRPKKIARSGMAQIDGRLARRKFVIQST